MRLTYEHSDDEVEPERQPHVVLDLRVHIGAHRVALHGNDAPLAALVRAQVSRGRRGIRTVVVATLVEPYVYRDPVARNVAGEPLKITAHPGHLGRRIPLPLLPRVLLVRRQALNLRLVQVIIYRAVDVVLGNATML